MRVYSLSLGCPKNRVDTERLLGSLGVAITPASSVRQADLVFINTCGFIAPAIEESVRSVVDTIQDIKELKSRKKRPLLAVAGCLVGRYGTAELSPELPEVDLWLPNQDLAAWPRLLAQALGLPAPVRPGRLLSTGPSFAWLKISDGCQHTCSFCTIPTIRGPLRSYPAEALKAEAVALLDQGVRELILVAQDLTDWGADLKLKHGLKSLIEQLLPLRGLDRLRLMYLYPAGLTDDLLSFLKSAGSPFVPYFDVPVQHAAPEILSRMGRPFARNPRLVFERIRKYFPEAALRTSLIVGFPGETETDFAALADFVEQTRFMHLGVFAYAPEDGTPAAAMPGQLPEAAKQQRRDALMQIQADISEDLLAAFNGARLPVLVDAPHPEWPGLHTGRTWFQAPEVDGQTYISGPGVAPGALVEADIIETRTYDLVALT